MGVKKYSIVLAAVVMASLTEAFPQSDTTAYAAESSMRDMTTMEIVDDMGIGINLGNTFESSGDWIDQWGDGTPNAYETAWGSPTVTEELIKGYASEGFDTLRVPVAWSNMMPKDNSYTISEKYMARVKQVVDWALDADLYVIVNLHWDGGWLEKLPEDHDNVLKKYSTIWEQVSDSFKEYGDKLIFESQNEELGWNTVWNQWSGSTNGKAESFGYVNEVNQKFVDIVRKSGGNNDKRHLLISGYNTSIDLTCDSLFKMPDDPAGRCAVSVHYYTPSTFTILTEDADWGKSAYTWGNQAELNELAQQMDMMKKSFVDKGIPVIIGEYGSTKDNKDPESVRLYMKSVCEAALSRGGMCPVMWDVTDLHYDRKTYKMKDETLHKALLELKEKYVKKSEKTVVSKGDINNDGKTDVADLVTLQQFILGKSELKNSEAADVCEDKVIDIYDIVALRKLLISTPK